METKLCRKCGREKSLTDFYKTTRGGCKDCVNAYHREWYRKNKAVRKKASLPPGQRRCSKCQEIKSLSQFYRDRSNASGYHHYCKHCSNSLRKARLDKKRKEKPVLPEGFKRCAGCERILPKSDFYKLKSSKDGFRYRCKECELAYKRSDAGKRSAQKYADRPDVKARRNAQRKAQREEGTAAWVLKEQEYRKEYNQRAEVVLRNREHNKAYRQRLKNKLKAREKSRKWRKENPEQRREQGRIKYLRKKGADGEHDLDQWKELLALCDFKCLACVEEDTVEEGTELQRDHIKPLTEGGSDKITNIQPLCLRHNAEKHTQTIDYRPQHIKQWAKTHSNQE